MTAPEHVVMVVANDVTTDTRVRKSALALAAAGLRVTVIGYASDGHRSYSALGPVQIIRVPVDFALRDARTQRRERRRSRRVPVGYSSEDAWRAARLQIEARRRDLELSQGLQRSISQRAVDVRMFALRSRSAAARRTDAPTAFAWRGWDKVMNSRPWSTSARAVVPEIDDYELAFGPVIDHLRADVIHAHDIHVLGVAARAKARAATEGRDLRVVYDAHEWVAGLSRYGARTRRVVAAWAQHEREFIHRADLVVTVSEPLASALQHKYQLRVTPTVVMNIPPAGAATVDSGSVRSVVGIDTDVPLLVYSGAVQKARGVQTAVAALSSLPGSHLAILAVPSPEAEGVQRLLRQANELGVGDRVHALAPVAPHEVSAFLRSADVGLIPLLHFGSHEMALPNKLFEYMHAEIPVVVSDCRAQREMVERLGIGTVHTAADPIDLARAVQAVLDDRSRYVDAVKHAADDSDFTWQHQAQVLQAAYRRLLRQSAAAQPSGVLDPAEPPEQPWSSQRGKEDEVVLGIGPSNSAGQAWAWAEAARRYLSDVRHDVVAIDAGSFAYPSDHSVSKVGFARDGRWGTDTRERALAEWTHALMETGRPIFGLIDGMDFRGDLNMLRAAGVATGLVFHGSEVRDPQRHAATHEFSPFADPAEPLTARLQQHTDRLLPLVASFEGPVFVSTPDQFDYLPEATWLPVVVDTEHLPTAVPVLERDVPLVVHAPSNQALKGTAEIESVLTELERLGRVQYRRIEGLAHAEIPAALADADVVIDQLLLGLYGVLACEGMALGRVVVSHVGDRLRSRVDKPIPIVEANPKTLRETLERIIDERAWAKDQAAAGSGFVADFHDGRYSAGVLADFLGRERPTY